MDPLALMPSHATMRSSMAVKERIPPQNLEAEQSLLGSLLIDKDAMVKIGDRTRPDDFYRDSHRHIFESMVALYERHDPIDILSLGNRLEEQNLLQCIGGRAYLVELSNIVLESTCSFINSS